MKKILMLLLLLLPLAMASCGDDKDEPTTNTTKDPDGTIIVNVNLDYDTSAGGCGIQLGKDYNLRCSGSRGQVSIVGPVKGIGNINVTAVQTQSLTWTRYAAAEVGYGYIFKVYTDDYTFENNQRIYYYDYYAVYVASEIGSTSGGVMGYTLKVRKLLENVPWQN